MFNTFESNNLNVLNSNILYSIISPDEIFRRYLLYVPMDNTKIKCIFHKERTPSLLFKNNATSPLESAVILIFTL
jgi:hypothetical protein